MHPFVTVSYAQSLDGKIATVTGDSQWISGAETLEFAHVLRRDNDAVLVGIGTVLADDPELSCRLPGNPPSPLRVILDSQLRLPEDAKICRTLSAYPTVVFTSSGCDRERRKRLEDMGLRIYPVDSSSSRRGLEDRGLDLEAVLDILGNIGIENLFVEGGSRIITSFLKRKLVDRLVVVCAPVIIGEGKSAVGDLGVKALSEAMRGHTRDVRRAGDDVIWEIELRDPTDLRKDVPPAETHLRSISPEPAQEAARKTTRGKDPEPARETARETARAVFFTAPRQVEVRDVPLEPGGTSESKILVKSRCIGISHGTELHFYRGTFVRGRSEDGIEGMDENLDYPLRYGYMNAGEAQYPDGGVRRVFAFYPHQDRFYAEPGQLIRIDDPDLSYEDIVLYPSVETAFTIALDTAPLPGEEVMIFGLGMIGLLTAEILSMNRSITLTAVERRNNRAEGGRRLGIDVLQSPPGDARFDRVIDTVGSEETLAGAMGCLRLEGTLIEAAWTGNRITGVELGKDFHRKRLTVKASQVSHIPGILLSRWDRERRSARVIEMLKAIRPSKYIGLRYPLEDASAAFERIDRGSGEGGKGGKGEEDLQIVLVP